MKADAKVLLFLIKRHFYCFFLLRFYAISTKKLQYVTSEKVADANAKLFVI